MAPTPFSPNRKPQIEAKDATRRSIAARDQTGAGTAIQAMVPGN
jgi:hypothetical protein